MPSITTARGTSTTKYVAPFARMGRGTSKPPRGETFPANQSPRGTVDVAHLRPRELFEELADDLEIKRQGEPLGGRLLHPPPYKLRRQLGQRDLLGSYKALLLAFVHADVQGVGKLPRGEPRCGHQVKDDRLQSLIGMTFTSALRTWNVQWPSSAAWGAAASHA